MLTINHLKNNQKIFQKTFCQLKNLLYFCTRFRQGSDAHKKEEKKYFKKYLVERKKGYTFAPAKRARSSLRNIDNTAQKDLD